MQAGRTGISALAPGLTIAIPTINSNRYIDIILEFYRDHGIPVTVFVDDRSDDDTFATAQKLATGTTSLSNRGTFVVEGLIEHMSQVCRTKWVLRIDDDELPSLAMLKFVQEAITNEEIDVYGFSRYQCAVSRNGEGLVHRDVSPSVHRQWRLYQPAKVRFIHGLHTPGFVWEDEKAVAAPTEASLIHLDWAVHTYDERRKKIERYDAHTPNEGTKWRAFYLYEEHPLSRANFSEFPFPEFAKAFLKISRRFEDLCVAFDPPHRLHARVRSL